VRLALKSITNGLQMQFFGLRLRGLAKVFADARQARIVAVEVLLRRPRRHRRERGDVLGEHRVDESPRMRARNRKCHRSRCQPLTLRRRQTLILACPFVDRSGVKDDPHDAARSGVRRHRNLDARIRAAAGQNEFHPIQVDAALTGAEDLESAVLLNDLHFVGARSARLRVGFSRARKRAVHRVAQVVEHVAIVALPRVVVQHARPLGRHELFGQFERRRCRVALVAEVRPNRLIVLDDRIVPNERLALQRASRQSGTNTTLPYSSTRTP